MTLSAWEAIARFAMPADRKRVYVVVRTLRLSLNDEFRGFVQRTPNGLAFVGDHGPQPLTDFDEFRLLAIE